MRRHNLDGSLSKIKNVDIKNGLVISIQDDKLFWEVVGLDLDIALVLLERIKYEILKKLDEQNTTKN